MDHSYAMRETVGYCLPQLTYLVVISIILQIHSDAYDDVALIYPDVMELFLFVSRCMWGKIGNRFLKLIMLGMNQTCFMEITKCVDVIATFVIWG